MGELIASCGHSVSELEGRGFWENSEGGWHFGTYCNNCILVLLDYLVPDENYAASRVHAPSLNYDNVSEWLFDDLT